MHVVVVRGTAGPLAGVVHRLGAGEAWTVGAPPQADLLSLGEGRLRIEPRASGILLNGHELVLPVTLDLTSGATEIGLPGDAVLEFSAEVVLSAPPPALAFAEEFERAAEPRGVPPRAPRRPLRLPHVTLPFRVSRSVGISLAVHAVALVLLFLVFLVLPHDPVERPRRVRFVFAAAPDATAAPEDRQAGEDAPDTALVEADADDLGQALEGDEARTTVPEGDLLALRRGGRERRLRSGDGNAPTEGALAAALGWLARHQSADGSWSADDFAARCTQDVTCAGPGERDYPEATTALALLAFLGAGHTHVDDGPWRATVRDGLAALLRGQRDDGSFARDGKRVYASAIATLALAEAHGLTGSEVLGKAAQRAATYFVRRQSPSGGWRYEPGDGRADSSVTGWVTLALVAAERAGLHVPAATLTRCRRWFEALTTEDGRLGYTGTGSAGDALLGVGLVCRTLLGTDPQGDALAPVALRLSAASPEWPRHADEDNGFDAADPLHWYYGSLGAFQAGGATWKTWQPRLDRLLLDHQRQDGCATGSYDAVGATGRHGGRVVTTALAALALEVTYRYPRATFGGR